MPDCSKIHSFPNIWPESGTNIYLSELNEYTRNLHFLVQLDLNRPVTGGG